MISISQKLVGLPFKHCSAGMNEGIDCFRLAIEYLRLKGAKIPEDTVFKGLPIFDYKGIYAENAERTMQLAVEFIESITKPIKVGFEIAGDILIMRMKKIKNLPLNIGVNAGNNFVIVAVRGDVVRLVNKSFFYIDKALRWA